MPTIKEHRDWFTFGKPPNPTPPIMLPPTLYARAKERGADMRGYGIQDPIPPLPKEPKS